MLCALGLTSRTQHTHHLDDFVKRRLEEKLKAARVNGVSFSHTQHTIWVKLLLYNLWLVFQSKGESLQDKEASLEFPSRLHSLRDRDTITRFDREVSLYLTLTGLMYCFPLVEVNSWCFTGWCRQSWKTGLPSTPQHQCQVQRSSKTSKAWIEIEILYTKSSCIMKFNVFILFFANTGRKRPADSWRSIQFLHVELWPRSTRCDWDEQQEKTKTEENNRWRRRAWRCWWRYSRRKWNPGNRATNIFFFFFCQNYFLPFFICIRWTNCLIFILLSEWRSSTCTNPRRFICHWPVTPGLLGNKESRVCRVPKTSSATKRTPVYTQLSNRYIISCLKYFNSHLHLPHMGKNYIMLNFHSSNLHQTAWKHETSIPGGWGSLCRGKASRIPDQWEYSGESDFENGGGNIS